MVECCVCRVTDTALQKLLTHCGALMDAKHYRKLHESLLPVVVAMQTAMTPPYTGAANFLIFCSKYLCVFDD